jgi:exosome complex exonuclease DIS3/RRP44
MLSTKSFIRKTKRGSVIKVVKEHYLRDDIYCGVPACCHCPDHTTTITSDQKEIMIPDTNVLYHQVDIMEHHAIYNVVVLQTTLEELRNRSLAVYNRIRALIADPDKRFFVFSNEHH